MLDEPITVEQFFVVGRLGVLHDELVGHLGDEELDSDATSAARGTIGGATAVVDNSPRWPTRRHTQPGRRSRGAARSRICLAAERSRQMGECVLRSAI